MVDIYNLNLEKSSIIKLLNMKNVKVAPIIGFSLFQKSDHIYYVEDGIVKGEEKSVFLNNIKKKQSVTVPILLDMGSMANDRGIQFSEVVQMLHFQRGIESVCNHINPSFKGNVKVVPSMLKSSYDPKRIACIYFVSVDNTDRAKIIEINKKFCDDNNLNYSSISPIGTNVVISKRDKINMYDIAKYANYIKLKGFNDNVIHIDFEINKNQFSVFDVRKELLKFMKHFFGE
jgi:hypothetical protein